MTILNLQKNDILDLTKKDPSLSHLLVGAGWDVATKKGGLFGLFSGESNYDLDLFALKLDEQGSLLPQGIVYFGNQTHPGIRLHGDNLTGEGEGDDEKISVDLQKLPSNCHRVVFGVAIYNAEGRGQHFGKVQNAYVRLVDEAKNGQEICRFNLTESGEGKTAIIMSELIKQNGDWSFKAIGDYCRASIREISSRYER